MMDVLNQFSALRQQIKDKGKEWLVSNVVDLLNKYSLDSIKWTQYQVYFNDGDLCPTYFNIENMQCSNKEVEEEYLEETNIQAWEEIVDLVGLFDEAFLEDWFGLDSSIEIRSDGTIHVSEYTEHD